MQNTTRRFIIYIRDSAISQVYGIIPRYSRRSCSISVCNVNFRKLLDTFKSCIESLRRSELQKELLISFPNGVVIRNSYKSMLCVFERDQILLLICMLRILSRTRLNSLYNCESLLTNACSMSCFALLYTRCISFSPRSSVCKSCNLIRLQLLHVLCEIEFNNNSCQVRIINFFAIFKYLHILMHFDCRKSMDYGNANRFQL